MLSYTTHHTQKVFFHNWKSWTCIFHLLQVFAEMERFDLGCGIGGGKDNADVLKVTRSDSLNTLVQEILCVLLHGIIFSTEIAPSEYVVVHPTCSVD